MFIVKLSSNELMIHNWPQFTYVLHFPTNFQISRRFCGLFMGPRPYKGLKSIDCNRNKDHWASNRNIKTCKKDKKVYLGQIHLEKAITQQFYSPKTLKQAWSEIVDR